MKKLTAIVSLPTVLFKLTRKLDQTTEKIRMERETAVCQPKLRSAVATTTGLSSTIVVVLTLRSVGLHSTSGMFTSADQVRYIIYIEINEDCRWRRKQ